MAYIYWTNPTSDQIWYSGISDLNGSPTLIGSPQFVVPPSSSSISGGGGSSSTSQPDWFNPIGLFIDENNFKIYWISSSSDSIFVANFDGNGAATNPVQIYDASVTSDTIQYLFVDTSDQKIYWTSTSDQNTAYHQVFVADISDLTNPSISDINPLFSDTDTISGISLDPINKKLYWCDSTANKIFVASINDPANPTTLLNISDLVNSDIATPNGLFVDTNNSKIYWANSSGQLWVADISDLANPVTTLNHTLLTSDSNILQGIPAGIFITFTDTSSPPPPVSYNSDPISGPTCGSGTTFGVSFAQEVSAPENTALDAFGSAVALWGDYAVVGAGGTSDGQGSAYVYHRSDSTWTLSQTLMASDGQSSDLFGGVPIASLVTDVAIAHNAILVGAMFHDPSDGLGLYSGAAYVFTLSDSTWVFSQELLNFSDGIFSDAQYHDEFGINVALSSDASIAVIGAPYISDSNGTFVGSSYLFMRSDTIWIPQQELFGSDSGSGDTFGDSLAISADGSTILVGAPGIPMGNDGRTYIFTYSDSTWSNTQVLIAASDIGRHHNFGASAALAEDGSVALIGDQNTLFIFKRSDTQWIEYQTLPYASGNFSDFGGVPVSIANNIITVGAYGDNFGAGAAYIYQLSDDQYWYQTHYITAPDQQHGNAFGLAVAISGNDILIGSPVNNAAYFYNLNAPMVVTLTASPSDAICTGQQVTLSASGAAHYLWFDGSSDGSDTFTPTQTSDYFVIGYSQNYTCSDVQTITITVSDCSSTCTPPTITGFSDIVVCGKSDINFTFTSSSSTTLSDVTCTLSFNGSIYTSDLSVGYTVINMPTPSDFGQYHATLTIQDPSDLQCSDSQTVSVQVGFQVSDVTITPLIVGSGSDTITITYFSGGPKNTFTYTFSDSVISDIIAQGSDQTILNFSSSTNPNCSDQKTLLMYVSDVPSQTILFKITGSSLDLKLILLTNLLTQTSDIQTFFSDVCAAAQAESDGYLTGRVQVLNQSDIFASDATILQSTQNVFVNCSNQCLNIVSQTNDFLLQICSFTSDAFLKYSDNNPNNTISNHSIIINSLSSNSGTTSVIFFAPTTTAPETIITTPPKKSAGIGTVLALLLFVGMFLFIFYCLFNYY